MTGAGLPFLVALALGKGPARGSSTRIWAARSAIAFVVVAAIATVLSKAPLNSLVGNYLSMTGLIFFAGLGACWALGTGVSVADRRLVENAIIWAGVLNATVAFFERFPGLSGIGLPLYGGAQPAGLLGNPVYLGGLLAATLALLATRVVERPALWAPVTAAGGIRHRLLRRAPPRAGGRGRGGVVDLGAAPTRRRRPVRPVHPPAGDPLRGDSASGAWSWGRSSRAPEAWLTTWRPRPPRRPSANASEGGWPDSMPSWPTRSSATDPTSTRRRR